MKKTLLKHGACALVFAAAAFGAAALVQAPVPAPLADDGSPSGTKTDISVTWPLSTADYTNAEISCIEGSDVVSTDLTLGSNIVFDKVGHVPTDNAEIGCNFGYFKFKETSSTSGEKQFLNKTEINYVNFKITPKYDITLDNISFNFANIGWGNGRFSAFITVGGVKTQLSEDKSNGGVEPCRGKIADNPPFNQTMPHHKYDISTKNIVAAANDDIVLTLVLFSKNELGSGKQMAISNVKIEGTVEIKVYEENPYGENLVSFNVPEVENHGTAILGNTELKENPPYYLIKNGWTSGTPANGITLTNEEYGGFKAGDVVTFKAYANTNHTYKTETVTDPDTGEDTTVTTNEISSLKWAKVGILQGSTKIAETDTIVNYLGDPAINENLPTDPTEFSYTLTSSSKTLTLVRSTGSTQVRISYISVLRPSAGGEDPGENPDQPEEPTDPTAAKFTEDGKAILYGNAATILPNDKFTLNNAVLESGGYIGSTHDTSTISMALVNEKEQPYTLKFAVACAVDPTWKVTVTNKEDGKDYCRDEFVVVKNNWGTLGGFDTPEYYSFEVANMPVGEYELKLSALAQGSGNYYCGDFNFFSLTPNPGAETPMPDDLVLRSEIPGTVYFQNWTSNGPRLENEDTIADMGWIFNGNNVTFSGVNCKEAGEYTMLLPVYENNDASVSNAKTTVKVLNADNVVEAEGYLYTDNYQKGTYPQQYIRLNGNISEGEKSVVLSFEANTTQWILNFRAPSFVKTSELTGKQTIPGNLDLNTTLGNVTVESATQVGSVKNGYKAIYQNVLCEKTGEYRLNIPVRHYGDCTFLVEVIDPATGAVEAKASNVITNAYTSKYPVASFVFDNEIPSGIKTVRFNFDQEIETNYCLNYQVPEFVYVAYNAVPGAIDLATTVDGASYVTTGKVTHVIVNEDGTTKDNPVGSAETILTELKNGASVTYYLNVEKDGKYELSYLECSKDGKNGKLNWTIKNLADGTQISTDEIVCNTVGSYNKFKTNNGGSFDLKAGQYSLTVNVSTSDKVMLYGIELTEVLEVIVPELTPAEGNKMTFEAQEGVKYHIAVNGSDNKYEISDGEIDLANHEAFQTPATLHYYKVYANDKEGEKTYYHVSAPKKTSVKNDDGSHTVTFTMGEGVRVYYKVSTTAHPTVESSNENATETGSGIGARPMRVEEEGDDLSDNAWGMWHEFLIEDGYTRYTEPIKLTTDGTANMEAIAVALDPETGMSINSQPEQSKYDVTTLVNELLGEDMSEAKVYDLNGREVKGELVPGIYVVVKGNKAVKVVVR